MFECGAEEMCTGQKEIRTYTRKQSMGNDNACSISPSHLTHSILPTLHPFEHRLSRNASPTTASEILPTMLFLCTLYFTSPLEETLNTTHIHDHSYEICYVG